MPWLPDVVERPVGNPWEIPQHGKHAFIVTIYRDENHDAGNPVSFDHILFYINLYPILKNHQKQPVRTILPLNSWFQSSRLLGELTAQRTTNGLDLHGFLEGHLVKSNQVSFKMCATLKIIWTSRSRNVLPKSWLKAPAYIF